MNNYVPISHKLPNKKLKLYFTKKELTRILKYYSLGVSKGKWKDYAIDFRHNEAYFHFYKSCSEKPSISILKKTTKKNEGNSFNLQQGYNRFLLNSSFDNLFIYLKD